MSKTAFLASSALVGASAIFTILGSDDASAQDFIVNLNGTPNWYSEAGNFLYDAIGQTFTINEPRRLDTVVWRATDWNGSTPTYTVEIRRWNGAGVAAGPIIASQSGSGFNGSDADVFYQGLNAELDAPGQYVFVINLESGAQNNLLSSDTYAGGTHVYRGVSETDVFEERTNLDLYFQLLFSALGPTATEELTAALQATGGASRLVVIDAGGVARDLGQLSLTTRNRTPSVVLTPAEGGGTEVVASSMSAPGMMGGVYTWAQITGFRTDEDNGPASIGGTGLQIGADIALAPNMVAGVSLGYSDISADDGDFSQDGTMTYLQPYFSYASGAWHGNASLIYGVGDYDQTSLGGDGSADTELLALTFEGGYDFALGDGYTVTPTLGLIHGREMVTGQTGTLAGVDETYDFTQASLGAVVSYDWADGSLYAGLHADHLSQDAGSVLTDGFLSEEGWTGRVELGTAMDLSNGLGLTTSIELSGIGGAAQTVSGGLRVAFTF